MNKQSYRVIAILVVLILAISNLGFWKIVVKADTMPTFYVSAEHGDWNKTLGEISQNKQTVAMKLWAGYKEAESDGTVYVLIAVKSASSITSITFNGSTSQSDSIKRYDKSVKVIKIDNEEYKLSDEPEINGSNKDDHWTVAWFELPEAQTSDMTYLYSVYVGGEGHNISGKTIVISGSGEPVVKHTVTFVDHDDTVLDTQTVDHGSDAKAPADPTRTGYSFIGWDEVFTNVTEDLTVKAQYSTNQYTVTFVDHDETVLKTQPVAHGSSATAPADPTRTGYSFIGWDVDFTNVTSDLTVTAQYTNNPVTYTVTFKDHDGDVLKTEQVVHGSSATAPADPTREGYTFTSWDVGFTNVTSDLTVTAQYTNNPVTYTVTFVDHDETVLKTQPVAHGSSATAPADPTRTGYTFTGWDIGFTNVTSDLTVMAQYTTNQHTVTFKDHDGVVLKTEQIDHGGSATAPADPTRTGYTFTGWDVGFTNVTEDLTVTAQYEIITYMVTFKDHDGTELKVETVDHGSSATAPADPTREGHTFTGWDKGYTNVTEDLVVTAVYAINVYTVTFKDHDGAELKSEHVEHGSDATAPADPDNKEGYHFTNWDKAFDNVTEDLTVTAAYAINEYTVTYEIMGDYFADPEFEKVTFEYGAAVTAIDIPLRSGYSFHGWADVPETMPAKDVIATGYYTKNYVAPDPQPALTVTKVGEYVDVNENDYLNVGDRIDYTITVTNTGDVVLTDIKVVDPLIGLDLRIDQLGVEESWEHLGSYLITGADIDAEKVINTVTVTANELEDPVTAREETLLDGEVEEVVGGEEVEEEEDPKEPTDPEVPVTGEALAWQYPALGALLMALGAVVLVLRRKEHA